MQALYTVKSQKISLNSVISERFKKIMTLNSERFKKNLQHVSEKHMGY